MYWFINQENKTQRQIKMQEKNILEEKPKRTLILAIKDDQDVENIIENGKKNG